jgi:hypothetical protein
VSTDEAYYERTAAPWFAQLQRDSGLLHYRQITDVADPNERLMRALTRVSEQYAATPEDQRVYGPEAAIKNLVLYVVLSIVIGSRVQDGPLIASLPAVLEPFAPLSPLIHAIWLNAQATHAFTCECRLERARALWLEVETALTKVTGAEMSYVAAVRGAVAYGLGQLEVRLGTGLAEQRALQLDQDPAQKVSAMSLRKIACLHQGDFEGAERFRKQGELLALEANVRSMFTSTLPVELVAHREHLRLHDHRRRVLLLVALEHPAHGAQQVVERELAPAAHHGARSGLVAQAHVARYRCLRRR